MTDHETPHSQPASDDPLIGQPGTDNPEWTRRNFIYGSAAAAAAMAFLRGAGSPPGARVPVRLAAQARGGRIRPLVASPYVCGQASQTNGVGNVVTVPITQGTGAGDAIVVCITTNGSNSLSTSVTPVADNTTAHGTNTYTQVNTESGSSTVVGWIYACVGSNLENQLTTSSEVTVTFKSTGTSAHSVTVLGVPGATAVDTTASTAAVASGSSATAAVQVTPSTANETLIALEANGNGSGAVAWTAPFQPLPVYGGGTITMVALSNESDLAPDGLMVAGGDDEGYFLTSNDSNPYGYEWSIINSGLYGQYWRDCACIAWSQLEQSADGGGVIYACAGNATGGGFLVSTDYGNSWSLRSGTGQPQFNGNHANSPLPSTGYPRSTGNLLAQDGTNEILYAASYANGVYRSSGGTAGTYGTTWQAIGPSGQGGPAGAFYCRSLALHPNLTTLFVATSPYNSNDTNGLNNSAGYVWMTTNNVQTTAHGSVAWVQLTGLPNVVEELAIIGDYIYAACGYYGIYWTALANLTASTASYAWTSLNNPSSGNYLNPISISTTTPIPPNGTNPYWVTLSGYSTGSGSSTVHTIVAFCDNPDNVNPATNGGEGNRSIMQITITNPAGTPSIAYEDLVAGVTVGISSYPTPSGSQTWWLPSVNEQVMGGTAYQNAHITIDTSGSTPVIYATGSEGVYYYSGGEWQIVINGMPLFSARSVALDPGDPQHIVWGDSDWCSWDFNWNITSAENPYPFFKVASPSQGSLESGSYPPTGQPDGALEGFALAFDQNNTSSNNAVYIATGEKYTNQWGDVIYHGAVATGTAPTWTTGTGLCGVPYGSGNAGGNIALGLAVARDTSGNQYVIAAVDGADGAGTAGGTGSIWLLSGGSWANPVSGLFGSENSTPYQPICIPASPLDHTTPGNSCVYVLDLGTGYLYRSAVTSSLSTSLKTWTKIWAYSGGNITDNSTGFLALNPTKLDELWITTPTALYQIENASTFALGDTPTTVTSFPGTPGGIAIAPGGTYGTVYCVGLGESGSPNTELFASTDDGSTWDSVGGPGVAANASNPGNMVVSPDGRIYIASGGNIVAYGYPSAGVTALGTSQHSGSNQYSAAAGQMVTSTAPVSISGSITSGPWIMLVAALET